VDLVFDNLYRDLRPTMDLKKDPKRDAFQKGYLDWDELAFLHEKGFFTKRDPRWREVFRILKDWRRFMPKDMGSVDNHREFVQGKGAMLWMHSMLVQRLINDPQMAFEWGVFYLPPITKATSRFGSGHDMCIIGEAATQFVVSNSAFADTGSIESSERLKRCIAFLQYATTSKSCKRIVNEIVALMPNVVGVDARPELAPFVEILKRDYTTTKWVYTFDLRFAEIMNRMLALYLMNGVSEDEFMDWMVSNVGTAASTVVRRKRVDTSVYEPKWQSLAPLRARMPELPQGMR
jgi:hypothetical protein